ncbi:MAG: YbaN family protein [Defluviitaleaceae bacterium]|nr:YbaN family protein [Defluviitaleaceae bacterium]
MKIKNLLLVVLGVVSLILGLVGIILPVLPTTPFVLLSAACFSTSNKKLDDWLRRSRIFAPFIENYRTGQGISRLHKIGSITFLWTGLIISMLITRTTFIFATLSIVGIGVTVHLLMIKTKKKDA